MKKILLPVAITLITMLGGCQTVVPCDEVLGETSLGQVPERCWDHKIMRGLRRADELESFQGDSAAVLDTLRLAFQLNGAAAQIWPEDTVLQGRFARLSERILELDPLADEPYFHYLNRWDDKHEIEAKPFLARVGRSNQIAFNDKLVAQIQVKDCTIHDDQSARADVIVGILERLSPLSDELERWKFERAKAYDWYARCRLRDADAKQLGFYAAAEETVYDYFETGHPSEAMAFAALVGIDSAQVSYFKKLGPR